MGTVATHALNPLILAQAPYDAVADFAPISLLVLVPNVLAVNPELPVNTVQELIALAKAEPGGSPTPPRGTARRCTCRASSSSRWPGSTSCTSPTRAPARR